MKTPSQHRAHTQGFEPAIRSGAAQHLPTATKTNFKNAATRTASKAAKHAAEHAPATPDAESGDENQAPSTPATGVKTKTPRKRGTPKVANKLATPASGAGPVDVTYKNESVLATPLPKAKGGGFGRTMKVSAAQPFEPVASDMLDNGCQAIIIKPAAPFQFMKLPKDIRGRILSNNLTPEHGDRGMVNKIDIVEKSGAIKATKEYAKEFKHNLPSLSSTRKAPPKLARLCTASDSSSMSLQTALAGKNGRRWNKDVGPGFRADVSHAAPWLNGPSETYAAHGPALPPAYRDPSIYYAASNAKPASFAREAFQLAGNKHNSRPQLLMFILQDKNSITYGKIKRYYECKLGIPSRCVQYAHVQKAQGSRRITFASSLRAVVPPTAWTRARGTYADSEADRTVTCTAHIKSLGDTRTVEWLFLSTSAPFNASFDINIDR
ncbi:hypothetical protein D6D27_00283 [Aureobasidium pullulans]|nr:hypothetical protein D6D27_00283 [Aureobasidium pullulans]